MKRLFLIGTMAISFLVLTSSSVAGKATSTSYAPQLSHSIASNGQVTITGTGFDPQYGGVTVEFFTPVGVAWVVVSGPDFTVTNFASEGPGSYKIQAWQLQHNRQRVVAEQDFTI